MADGSAATDTTTTGLTADEVAVRLADGRSNAFVEASSRSVWSIVRANVFTLFNAIIAACFLVLLLIGRWQDALFGLSALANAFIGSGQEYRAKRALDRLALLNAPHARVLRAGEQREIVPSEVVLDDVLVLRSGDQVAADARVVRSTRLQLDESMLTGESDPVDKEPGAEVLSGSIVVAGDGLARVEKVGADSFANRFASEARRFSLMTSELRSSINRVLKWVTWLIGPAALLVLNAQMVAAGGWADAISSGAWTDAAVGAIAAIVAMIPLGLVLMTSITFAVGAVKLSRRQVLVQELAAVEGLARVDIICLDKTGTLTEGDIVFDGSHPLSATAAPGWERVLGWYGAQPDANATARCLAAPYTEAVQYEPAERIEFSSARKWSAVAFDSGPVVGTWVLGGPEMVFPTASDGTDPDLAAMAEQVSALAGTGKRTLVLARSDAVLSSGDAAGERLLPDVRPVTLLTFRERVRPDARETLDYFASQGVDVRVISGDNPATVAAIAREVGLDAPQGYDARDLPDDDDALADVIESNVVFGRVTPQQKKRMVLALRARGRVVAMTGDGVNDALAIKEADIGIAMNSGSAATKAVARLILLDGQFSHLPGVVSEGRQVIANIERISMLFLTKTVYASALAIVFGALLLTFPFLPRQLSAVDGLTIGIPAFFLALLPNPRRYIAGFLRRSLIFAVPAGLVIAAALTGYTLVARGIGIDEAQLRTGSTLILSIVGLWVLIVLSRPVTRFKTIVIGAMMIGLVLIYTVPIISDFLQFVDPGAETAVLVVIVSALSIGGIEIVRFVHRRVVRASIAPAVHPSQSSSAVLRGASRK
ncbi:MAG: HAD-IC family P-type ATPase [Leifsonia sp.]